MEIWVIGVGLIRLLGITTPQLAPADHLSPIPDSVSFEQAAPILCAGVTTYAAIKHTEAKPGEFLTIIGGRYGHMNQSDSSPATCR